MAVRKPEWKQVAKRDINAEFAATVLQELKVPGQLLRGGAIAPATAQPNDEGKQDPKLGEILQRTKNLSQSQVDAALYYQRKKGVRFGEAVVRLGLAGADDVMWALSQQFNYPYAQIANANLNDELVLARQPFSDTVEAFRDVRAQLLLNGFGSAERRSALAIVSADRGDGKTFIGANLAVAFGQLPGRTLIIDADMRSPRLHEIFNCPGTSGLASVLRGSTRASVIRPVNDLPNLYILPVGAAPPNPAELFQTRSFALLVHELVSKFDYVLVDTPAASQGSDARVVASHCGSAMVVGRKDKTRLPGLKQLVTQLNTNHVKIAGMVMNEY